MCHRTAYEAQIDWEAAVAEHVRPASLEEPIALPGAVSLVATLLVAGCALIAVVQWLL